MEALKKMLNINSTSGNENAIREFLINETKKYNLDTTTDALGNLIVHKPGKGEKIMLAAHMDEIGIIVTFIDDKGFIRFRGIGGVYVKELNHRRVIFNNGVIGVVSLEEKAEKPDINKMYIDIGANSKEEAEKLVKIGDTAAFCGDTVITDNVVISKALDNRAGCYALLKTLENTLNSESDIYFVFTVQEEVGLRGAHTSAFSVNPDIAIAVDVTDTGDTPNCPDMAVQMGKGAAVKVMDRSVICHPQIRTALIEAAKKADIPYQLEIMTDGGTDAGAIHLSGDGVKTGGVSIPTRYIHSPSEMASIEDINNVIKLLCEYLNNR